MKCNTDDAGLSAFGTELKAPYFTPGRWVSAVELRSGGAGAVDHSQERRDPRRHLA